MSSQHTLQLGLANPGGTRHANAEDLVLYALQFLPGDQAAGLADHVEHCDRCRNELALAQGDLAACAFTSDLQLPSALARQRLRTQVARENHPVLHTTPALAAFGRNGSILTPSEDNPPKRSVALTLLGWLGRIVAAGLAVVAAILYQGEIAQRARLSVQSNELARLTADAAHATPVLDALNDTNAMRMVLTAKPPAKPQPLGRVTYNPSNGSLIFLVDDLDPLVTGKVYELWLLPADGRNPIAAAVFHPDNHGNASVILPALPTGVAAKGFAVSIEDDGGTQTPTPPFVMAGS
jgi:anti-sigma-K factor RskA